jgi:hypothetical protein
MARPTVVRVLTASEDPAIHANISRALSMLAEQDAASIKLLRADIAAETLRLAAAEQPRIAFLDVTIGDGAGLGLVHFLQSMVPGIVVVAIVPPSAGADLRLVEQAASLGASWVLLGELTGDDVLRAFNRVLPARAASVMPKALRPPSPTSLAPPPTTPTAGAPAVRIAEARTFRELDDALGRLAGAIDAGATEGEPRALVGDIRQSLVSVLASERSQRSPMQDLDTSAYSFAYFVDLAGREVDLARRHGRRFALATIEVEPNDLGFDVHAAVELVLAAVRDTDVVARADQDELLLMLPETGNKGARALRRRVLERLPAPVRGLRSLPLRVGIAGFPYDGEDLSRLLRVARRRAERWAPLDAPFVSNALLSRALLHLGGDEPPNATSVAPLTPLTMPLRDAWALIDTLVRESTRAGDATVALHAPADEDARPVGLAQGVRAAAAFALGPLSSPQGTTSIAARGHDVLSLITGQSRLVEEATFEGLELFAILAEHACYGLVGRVEGGRLHALHGHDLPFVEALLATLEQPTVRKGALAYSTSSAAPSSGRTLGNDGHSHRSGGLA